jgi:acylphosphatase
VKRVHVVVAGRVQGVFFRAACAERARDLGIGGWVRNAEDARVEAEFDGTPAAVDDLVAWCRHGPPHARVDVVQVRIVESTGARNFEIRS